AVDPVHLRDARRSARRRQAEPADDAAVGRYEGRRQTVDGRQAGRPVLPCMLSTVYCLPVATSDCNCSMEINYDPQQIEAKWQQRWAEQKLFETEADAARKKYYVLEMLPYPSGDIHMGHVRNYSIGDALARYMRMKGFNVLHPIGWDAFGLPAENAAIKSQRHPSEFTFSYIDRMRGQLQRLGVSYDWRREIASCVPEYYRWNQWFFLKMYERGLAYRKQSR